LILKDLKICTIDKCDWEGGQTWAPMGGQDRAIIGPLDKKY